MSLRNINKAWDVSESPVTVIHSVHSVHVINAVNAIRAGFLILNRDSDSERSVLNKAWRLQHAILNTLHPFDSDDLGLSSFVETLRESSFLTRSTREWMFGLEKAVNGLIHSQDNPKMEAIKSIIAPYGETPSILVWNRPDGNTPLGYAENQDHLHIPDSEIVLKIAGPPSLISAGLQPPVDAIFVTSPLDYRRIDPSLIWRIMRRGLAASCFMLRYDKVERQLSGAIESEAPDTFRAVFTGNRREIREFPVLAQVTMPEITPETPAPWDDMTTYDWSRFQNSISIEGDEVETVPAVIFALTGDKMVSLSPNDKIPVLGRSDRIEMLAANHVETGDVVAIRKGYGDDHLRALADQILSKQGLSRAALENQTASWKVPLGKAIADEGLETLKIEMKNAGFEVNAGSIKSWAGSEIYGPRKRAAFRVILDYLIDHKFISDISERSTFYDSCWKSVATLRRAGVQAGFALSRMLEDKLARLKSDGKISIGQEIGLDGSGNENRRYLVLAVHAVMLNTTADISILGRIFDKEDY